MEKEFIPYELAVKLKELGFDKPCFNLYHKDTHQLMYKSIDGVVMIKIDNHNKTNHCSSPTFSQAFRWFREKYELSCSVELTDNSRHYYFDFTIYDSKNRDWNDEDCFDSCKRIYDDGTFGTYEEAELACLNKLIEIVESKSK